MAARQLAAPLASARGAFVAVDLLAFYVSPEEHIIVEQSGNLPCDGKIESSLLSVIVGELSQWQVQKICCLRLLTLI